MEFPFGYERIAATTWAYASSLLMLCVFFKFNRFWSVRNFDLLLIILLAPGLLCIEGGKRWLSRDEEAAKATVLAVEGPESMSVSPGEAAQTLAQEPPGIEAPIGLETPPEGTVDLNLPGYVLQLWGYYWLFGVGAIFLIRMLLDPLLVRRPLLEPNLSIGGLVFMGCSLMIFLFANVVSSQPSSDDLRGARDAVKMLQREATQDSDLEQLKRSGPGYTLFSLVPVIPSFDNPDDILAVDADTSQNMGKYVITAKSLAIASHVFIVLGLVLLGHYHFNNFSVGVGMAVIYLMLPYTAMFTGHVLHVLPAALLVWALLSFNRPWAAGIFIGLAIGVSYYPLFLLPLWISFYWEKGLTRFLVGMFAAFTVCIAGLVFTSTDFISFMSQLRAMFGFWLPKTDGLEGIWALGWDYIFRLPIMVAFVALCISFAFWPTRKNVGTLISYSCAIMVAVQFWHGFGGGLYMAWYVPLALMAFFRPNMDGRVASLELSRAEENRRLKHDRVELAEQL